MNNFEMNNSEAVKKAHFLEMLEEVILACKSWSEQCPGFESAPGFKCTMALANALKSAAPRPELIRLLGSFEATMLVNEANVLGFEEAGKLYSGFSDKMCHMREELTACLVKS